MDWYKLRNECRGTYRDAYDAKEAATYDDYTDVLRSNTEAALVAYFDDLKDSLKVLSQAKFLDVGAGTGRLTQVFIEKFGLPQNRITALDASSDMLDELSKRYPDVKRVNDFADLPQSRARFDPESFDIIALRCAANGLADPLEAFSNFLYWLKPSGSVVIIESLFSRDSWPEHWGEFVDVLPCAANQSMALFPYLLERSGFSISTITWLERLNALIDQANKEIEDTSKQEAHRYLIVATKPGPPGSK